MKIFKEFKSFVMRGNVVDMAIGVVIGSTFGKIVTSLVNDILMPLISLIIGKVNFTDMKVVLAPATDSTTEVAMMYGNFLQNVMDFLIIAFSIFLVIRLLSRVKKKEEPTAAAIDTKEVLLKEIRDLLKTR